MFMIVQYVLCATLHCVMSYTHIKYVYGRMRMCKQVERCATLSLDAVGNIKNSYVNHGRNDTWLISIPVHPRISALNKIPLINKMLNQQYSTLNSIESYIEPLLKRVLQTERLGVCCGTIELDSVSSSCGRGKGDRFKLTIPYAGQNLIWDVLFDSKCQEMGPDFVFSDDTFLTDPDVDILTTLVPSLVDWDPSDNSSLLNVLIELLLYYKQHQIHSLEKQADRLQLEYSTLVGETDICAEDVEIILIPVGNKPTEARFFIRLPIDFSQLPVHGKQSQNNAAMLLVTFHGPDWNRIVPQLFLSKNLEQAFGSVASLHIPPFTADKYLMDYVPEVKKFIGEKINSLVTCFERKKNFVASLITLERGSLIEYDAVEFSSITILQQQENFYILVHFHLPQNFPKEKPIITLESVYHMTPHGKLYSEIVPDIPYSPRWESLQTVIMILIHIIDDALPKFRMNSMKNHRFTN